MAPMQNSRGADGRQDWLRRRSESRGLTQYVAVIRERWWLVTLTTLVAVAAAVAYAALAPKTYQAEADLLITPVSAGDAATAGLGLLTESNDPTQTISTAARLISSNEVGARALQRLGRPGRPEDVFRDVAVEPVAQSNLVAVRATAASPRGAADLATAVARAATEVRTRQLRLQVDALIPTLERQVAALPPADRAGPDTLGARLSNLRILRTGDDPTIRLATAATAPDSPKSPRPKLALVAGLLGGLILGIGAAFASQALDSRLRREEQVAELFRLPVLGRIPRAVRRPGAAPLGADRLSRPAVEAFRTLRATVMATVGEHAQSVLVTSSGSGEGKTTTALNLAHALSLTGAKVILIEADVRRPMLGATLGARPTTGIASVLEDARPVAEALTTMPAYGENLRFLLAERPIPEFADRLGPAVASRMLEEAEQHAKFVVIDSPPLTEVIDALPLAQAADAVLIVVRFGKSRMNRLARLGEILHQGGAQPIGIAEIGSEAMQSSYYTDGPRAVRTPA